VEVVSVSRLTPRLVSVLVRGDALDGFRIEAPTGHVKVFLPADGQDDPAVRTYTPVRFDEAGKTLELQFVLHGTGPASEWAERAAPGDKLAVAGPGGRFALDETAAHWWLAADESAIPAVATLLAALPATATADVHIEVADADDEIAFDSPAKTTVSWHHRRSPGRSAPNWTRRRGPLTSPPGHGSGWPARPPRCAVSAGTSATTGGCRPTRR
jgi:NADPH-dependent ferric siderophore reductase